MTTKAGNTKTPRGTAKTAAAPKKVRRTAKPAKKAKSVKSAKSAKTAKTAKTAKKKVAAPKKKDRTAEAIASAAASTEVQGPRIDDENRRLQDELGLYRVLGDFESAGFDLEKLIGRFLTQAMHVLKTSAGTVFSVDGTRKELEFAVVRGKARQRLRGVRIPWGRGVAGWVARTGKPRLVRDARRDRLWWKELADYVGYPTKDILAVPLRSRSGKLVGVVELLNKDDHRGFTKQDLQYMVNISGSVGTLLENARLLTESQRRNRQLRLLNEVSQLINSSLEPDSVQRRTIRAAIELVDSEAGSLLLLDEASGELYFKVVIGERAREVKRTRLKPGEGIAGWVVENRKPVIIDDCAKDERWSSRVDRNAHFMTRNMICVPVIHKDRSIGALQALNHKVGKFDGDDLEMLSALADRVATALENARLFEQLQRTLMETAEALAESIEVRDAYTGGHTRRVVEYSMAIASQLKLSTEQFENLRLAAILHDIGKIGVDDQVLRKPGRLDQDEFAQMKRHPVLGEEILGHIRYFAEVRPGLRSHHERHDGRGYPDAMDGGRIPIIARVIAVADTYDAMTSDRPYRQGLDERFALAEIRYCAGTQFDPQVVRAFCRAFEAGDITGQKEKLPPKPRQRPSLETWNRNRKQP